MAPEKGYDNIGLLRYDFTGLYGYDFTRLYTSLYNTGRAYYALSGVETVPAGTNIEIRLGVAYALTHPMLRKNQYLLTRFELGDYGLIFAKVGEFDKSSGVGIMRGGLVPDPSSIITGTQETVNEDGVQVISVVDATILDKNSNDIAYLLSHIGALISHVNDYDQ